MRDTNNILDQELTVNKLYSLPAPILLINVNCIITVKIVKKESSLNKLTNFKYLQIQLFSKKWKPFYEMFYRSTMFFSINNLLCFKVSLWVLAISALSLSFVGFLNSFTSTFSASSKVIFYEKYIEEHLPANIKEIEKIIIICISDAFSNECFFCVLSENKSNLPT